MLKTSHGTLPPQNWLSKRFRDVRVIFLAYIWACTWRLELWKWHLSLLTLAPAKISAVIEWLERAAPLSQSLALVVKLLLPLLAWLRLPGLGLLKFLDREGSPGEPLCWRISCSTSAEGHKCTALPHFFLSPVPSACCHSWHAICTGQTDGPFPCPMPSAEVKGWQLAATDVRKDKVNVTGSTKKIHLKPWSIWGSRVPAVQPLE